MRRHPAGTTRRGNVQTPLIAEALRQRAVLKNLCVALQVAEFAPPPQRRACFLAALSPAARQHPLARLILEREDG